MNPFPRQLACSQGKSSVESVLRPNGRDKDFLFWKEKNIIVQGEIF